MKFARYWRDKSVDVGTTLPGGRTRVSVWGASNESPDDASRHAESRADAFRQLLSRGIENLREYEYWNGYIREEVVEQLSDGSGKTFAVLTRNSYGAIILNTETVLFGDIDEEKPAMLDRVLQLFGRRRRDKEFFLSRIRAYQQKNPQYVFRVYETRAGIRFIITNRLFDADSKDVTALFRALGVDPLYTRICRQQTCFRARLTPKPWRIGLDRPSSRFPRADRGEQMTFESWLRDYSSAAKMACAARLLADIGAATAHPDVERVILIHDRYAMNEAAALA